MNYAGVLFYNDGPELLQRCIRALKACKIKVIAVDGPWKEFVTAARQCGVELAPHSTDGCLEVARAEADLVIEAPDNIEAAPYGELHKRNIYIREVPVGDYVWYVDADEIMRPFVLPEGEPSKDVYILDNYWHQHRVRNVQTIRVYKKYPDLGHKYQHARLYRLDQHDPMDLNSGLIFCGRDPGNARFPVLKDVFDAPVAMDHYLLERPQQRVDIKNVYLKLRTENNYPWTRS